MNQNINYKNGGNPMNNQILNHTLGDIVTALPRASEIFKKYRIDFCCGGHRSLKEALMELPQDETQVINELKAAYEETRDLEDVKDFRTLTPHALMEYIESTHHVFTRNILPKISEGLLKVLRAHGANHKELFEVHKQFNALKADLEMHLIKEEEILFPLVKDYAQDPSAHKLNHLRQVLEEVEGEHDGAGDILKTLRRLTQDYTLPQDACTTFAKTYEYLQALESDLFQHIHLENNILFKEAAPQAREQSPAAQ